MRFPILRKHAHWKMIAALLMVYDVVAVTLSFALALWFRFDCQISKIPIECLRPFAYTAPVYALVCVPVFWRCRLYHSVWRFARSLQQW